MERKLERGFVIIVGGLAIGGSKIPVFGGASHYRHGKVCVVDFPQRSLARSLSIEISDGAVVISRDLLGTVPVYYRAMARGGWAVSDDIVALKNLSPCISAIDRNCLANYALSLQLLDVSDKTVWKGIRRILPGACMRFSSGRVSHLVQTDNSVVDGGLTPQRLISGLRSELCGEVAPIALSRGTDSTLLAMLMASRRDAHAVTMSFPSFPDVDESEGVKGIAKILGMPYSHLVLEPEQTNVFEDAFIEAAPVLHSGISHEARFFEGVSDLGFKAVTTGVGADQLCYAPFSWALRQSLGTWSASALRWRAQTPWLRFCKEAAVVWLRGVDRISLSHLRGRRQLDAVAPSWKHADFEVDGDMLKYVARMSQQSRLPGRSYLEGMIVSRQWESMLGVRKLLSVKTGVEIGTPFLSESLWNSALKTPSWQLAGFVDRKSGGPWDKLPIRRAHDLLGLLPPQVAWRGKVATFDSFVCAAIFLPQHQQLIRDLVNGMVLAEWSIVDERKFQGVVHRLLDDASALPTEGIARVWSTLFSEYWVRRMSSC